MQITFSNGFSFKKLLSVFLFVSPSFSFVCLSVSVCLCLSHLFHYVPITVSSWNFQEGLPMTEVMSMQKCKVRGQEVKTQISCFGTITPVWFHIWRWNDAQSLILFRSGALLIFKVICQISRSHGYENHRFRPRLGVSGLSLQFEFTDGFEMICKAWSSIEEVPYCLSRSSIKFQGHAGQKIANFDPNWGFLDCNYRLNSPMDLKWCTKLDVVRKRCPIVFRGHPPNLKVTWTKKSMIWIQF